MKKIIRLGFLLALLACLGGCAASPHVRHADLKKLRAELDEALDSRKVSIFFTETPLSKVLLSLTHQTEISCVSDLPKGTDPLVTIRVNNKTLRSTLHWIALLSGTRCGIKDGAIHFDKSAKGLAEIKQRYNTVRRKEIEEDLDTKKISIFFSGTRFSSILQFLGDLTETDYVADLGEEAVDPLITLHVSNMRFRNVVNWLATLSDTQWSIEYEAIYFRKAVAETNVWKTKATKKKRGEKTTKQKEAGNIPDTNELSAHFTETSLKEIEGALGTRKVSIFFTETPLSELLAFLADLTEMDFVSDLKKGTDPLITIRVNSMTLRNALNWIAILSRTEWQIKDGAIYFKKGTGELAEDRKQRDAPWREPIEDALDTKKVSIFFTETPFSSILQFFGDLTEIDFVLGLGQEDIDPLITIRVNSMTLRNALNWIATLSDTQWGIKYEAIYFRKALAEKHGRKTEAAEEKVEGKTTKQKEVENILDTKKLSVHFTKTELAGVLQFLGDLTKIDFIFKSPDSEGPMLTTRVERMRVRSFLDLVAEQTKTKWTIKDEAVYFYQEVPPKRRGKKLTPNKSIQPTARARRLIYNVR